MKTAIVTAVLILVCILSVTAWLTTGLDLRIVRANVDYYYTELTAASHQIELANAKIAELECEAEKLKNRLEVANDIVAELRDRNHELRSINYALQQKAELRYFESAEALEKFLFESDVDHHIYITACNDFHTYDCEDYAIALRDDAHAKGFHMSIQAV